MSSLIHHWIHSGSRRPGTFGPMEILLILLGLFFSLLCLPNASEFPWH